KHVEPAGLDGFNGHAVNSRRAVVGLGQLIGCLASFRFTDVAIQAPETPGRFSLRLGVYPPAQVWQTQGCLCHRTPASHVVEGVTISRGPALHGHSPASALLRPPPSPSRLRLIARWSGYPTYLASADCAAGRGGSLQLLSVSLSPCGRSHPAGGG